MQAVVLVGGEGTRLRPLTLETPKPMVPVMNMPFLERTLRRLKEAGIDDVILPACYLPDAITSYFGDGSRLGLRLRYVIEEVPLGTAGALKNVEQYIDGPFFVLNGDVLTSLDLRAMLAYHRQKGGLATLHLIPVEDPSPFGCVVHDAAGRVQAFVEKPKREEAPTNEINAGTYLMEREVLEYIPAGRPVSIERETFPQLIAAGRPLYAYTTDDYWIDLGRPEAYLDAHRHIFEGTMPLGGLRSVDGPGRESVPTSALRPPIFIGNNCSVAPDAVVGPYTVLGDGCDIGPGAVVADSLLWDDVTVEEGAQLAWSIVASRARIGAGAQIAHGSVIGHEAEIPAGARVEENARIAAIGQ
ncbi:MAG: Nucleotidyl transferase [Candidatus Eremiobacteraeota bacterium]|nr:Nucleotidyl transferase [Candidatus Eremiobacteraeota bacterium]